MTGRGLFLPVILALACLSADPAASQGIGDRFERIFGSPAASGGTITRRTPRAPSRPAAGTAEGAANPPALDDIPVPTARPEGAAGGELGRPGMTATGKDNPADAPRSSEKSAPVPPTLPGRPTETPELDDGTDSATGPDGEAQEERSGLTGEPGSEEERQPQSSALAAPVEPPRASTPVPAYVPPDEARTSPELKAPIVPPSDVTPQESVEAAAAVEDALACEAELTARGAEFTVAANISDGDCGVLRPLQLTRTSSGATLEPATQMLCRTALAFDIWVSDGVVPAVGDNLDGATLQAIRHASTYVCRSRSSESSISEHSRGSAIDVAAVLVGEGVAIEVKEQAAGSPEDRLLATIRRAACGPFKTVLGPGTDADHADHFHLDIAARSNGSTYCR